MESSLPAKMEFTREPPDLDESNLILARSLDAAAPGYLNYVSQATALKRHCQFAAYGRIDLEHPEIMAERLRSAKASDFSEGAGPWAQIANLLIHSRPRQILKALFGSVPPGLISALARCDRRKALSTPEDYSLAYRLFADPDNKDRARLLTLHGKTIYSQHLHIAATLDPILLHIRVFERLRFMSEATLMNDAVALIRRLVPDATDAALKASLDRMPPGGRMYGPHLHLQLQSWIKHWLSRATRLPVVSPIPSTDRKFRLIPVSDLAALGRKYNNCARRLEGYVSAGVLLTFEWINREAEAVVLLRSLTQGRWVVEQIRSKNNGQLEEKDLCDLRSRLHDYGILFYRIDPQFGSSGIADLLKIRSPEGGPDLVCEPARGSADARLIGAIGM